MYVHTHHLASIDHLDHPPVLDSAHIRCTIVCILPSSAMRCEAGIHIFLDFILTFHAHPPRRLPLRVAPQYLHHIKHLYHSIDQTKEDENVPKCGYVPSVHDKPAYEHSSGRIQKYMHCIQWRNEERVSRKYTKDLQCDKYHCECDGRCNLAIFVVEFRVSVVGSQRSSNIVVLTIVN